MSETFATILCGERLTHLQLARRNAILTELLNFLMSDGGACCRKSPNWRKKLYGMKLSELEEKFEALFGRKY